MSCLYIFLYIACICDGYVQTVVQLTSWLLCCGQAGDALFIPEGWWHQIDSDGLTVAVSHWWAGPAAAATANPDMAPYHLRRLLRAEIERRTSQLLRSIAPLPLVSESVRPCGSTGGACSVLPLPLSAGQSPAGSDAAAYGADAVALASHVADDENAGGVSGEVAENKALSVLVLAVGRAQDGAVTEKSDRSKRRRTTTEGHGSPLQAASTERHAVQVDSQQVSYSNGRQLAAAAPTVAVLAAEDGVFRGADDSEHDLGLGLHEDITRAFATLSPAALRRVLDAAAARFPRTLEALLLHALPPAAAELLTQKLERGDEELLRAGREDEQVREVPNPLQPHTRMRS